MANGWICSYDGEAMVLFARFELWLLCFLNGILGRKKGREGVVAGFGWVWWQGEVRMVGWGGCAPFCFIFLFFKYFSFDFLGVKDDEIRKV